MYFRMGCPDPYRTPNPRGTGGAASWTRRGAVLGGVVCALVASGCGGALGHRSHAEMAGELPVGKDVARIRVEIPNGTIEVHAGTATAVRYAGGVRRAADTREDLALLEQVPLQLVAEVDAADPQALIVRAPGCPTATPGAVFALELALHVPPTIPVDVVVAANGHVTVVDRLASTSVETKRGDLRFERCAGGVRARTGRGMVIAFGHRGDLDVQALAGDMQAFVEEAGERLRLVTGQGTIQCHVPAAIEFDLDARAEIGKIGNGFGLVPTVVRDFGSVLTGLRGSARTKVVLRTGSGHLSIAPIRSE